MDDLFAKLGEPKSFKQGETLFEAGFHPTEVILISKGYVFLYRGDVSADNFLADLGKGELLGETSVLFGEEHSMTAIAGSDLEVFAMSKENYLKIARKEAPMMRFTINSLSKRLRRASAQMTRFRKHLKGVRPDNARIVVEGGSPYMQERLPEPLMMENLPFIIGSTNVDNNSYHLNDNGLFIKAPEISSFEMTHVAIQKSTYGVFVADQGTVAGGILNGVAFNHGTNLIKLELRLGDNYLVLGTPISRARFILTYLP